MTTRSKSARRTIVVGLLWSVVGAAVGQPDVRRVVPDMSVPIWSDAQEMIEREAFSKLRAAEQLRKDLEAELDSAERLLATTREPSKKAELEPQVAELQHRIAFAKRQIEAARERLQPFLEAEGSADWERLRERAFLPRLDYLFSLKKQPSTASAQALAEELYFDFGAPAPNNEWRTLVIDQMLEYAKATDAPSERALLGDALRQYAVAVRAAGEDAIPRPSNEAELAEALYRLAKPDDDEMIALAQATYFHAMQRAHRHSRLRDVARMAERQGPLFQDEMALAEIRAQFVPGSADSRVGDDDLANARRLVKETLRTLPPTDIQIRTLVTYLRRFRSSDARVRQELAASFLLIADRALRLAESKLPATVVELLESGVAVIGEDLDTADAVRARWQVVAERLFRRGQVKSLCDTLSKWKVCDHPRLARVARQLSGAHCDVAEESNSDR